MGVAGSADPRTPVDWAWGTQVGRERAGRPGKGRYAGKKWRRLCSLLEGLGSPTTPDLLLTVTS